jgi:hypothetical protein
MGNICKNRMIIIISFLYEDMNREGLPWVLPIAKVEMPFES